MDARHGHFFWNELITPAVNDAKSFYEASLGWTFESVDMGDPSQPAYWLAMADGQHVGGIMDAASLGLPEEKRPPPHWLSYIQVDDLDKRMESLEAAGGSVMRPPFDVPNIGRIAIIKDGGGAVVGWITPTSASA